ncbi:hypothetical protein DY138_00680 [Apilactobacillus timberlakei]|uniref:hypothetical protein n=1 Tax=Apilactobacillus TaxID=2767877 RepID=UPI000D01B939|nr:MULTISPECIES: hypothetical protein [Apilactobacillus]TPR19984.1 hypothetical protein DY138_00680 [Apilactobacillus timberlakei]TPR21702.1 hypothetical protein DY061_00595 [Apilactobacillus timberlakei]TPR22948.1 hypothetical protein DY083_02415 [Apilactobacillus timberlakei]TPR40413.1 hypothetical protein DY119_01615 [Apilactobacillus micheneri]
MKSMETRNYTTRNEIAYDLTNLLAKTATVDYPNVAANSEGKKIIKAGTPVGGSKPFPFVMEQTLVPTSDTPSGVLMADVDVTNGPETGTVIVKGAIILSNMDSDVRTMYQENTIKALPSITVTE